MDRKKVLINLGNFELGDRAKRTRWAAEKFHHLEKPLKVLSNEIPGSYKSRLCCNLPRQKLCFLGEVEHASTDSAEEVGRKSKLTATDLRSRVDFECLVELEVRQLKFCQFWPRAKCAIIT
jgi:hypothetical protein